MEKLILASSPKTPEVVFDAASGVFLLKGRSIPENSIEFYQPLNEWVERYTENPGSKTRIEIRLEYFNTSSSKCLLILFKKLEKLNGTDVSVNWYFEEDDEDMKEAGEDYQAIINLPFTIIEVEEI